MLKKRTATHRMELCVSYERSKLKKLNDQLARFGRTKIMMLLLSTLDNMYVFQKKKGVS